jgi:hypothetical protein
MLSSWSASSWLQQWSSSLYIRIVTGDQSVQETLGFDGIGLDMLFMVLSSDWTAELTIVIGQLH